MILSTGRDRTLILAFSGLALIVILALSGYLPRASVASPNVSYMNLRFAEFKYPLVSGFSSEGFHSPPPYTAASVLHGDGINGVRFGGTERGWPIYDIAGVSSFQSALNYQATAFDQQGISIVYELPTSCCTLGSIPPDLVFYSTGTVPPTEFGGTGGAASNAINPLFTGNAIYWGKTTNYQYTATNGTVIPAGKLQWPWASKYQGLPVWQVLAMMMADTIPTLKQHPSTFAFKLWNEPFTGYGWSAGNLQSYYNYMGQQLRALGWTGFIVYSDYTVTPGVSDIEQMAPKSSSGSYLFPLMFEFHYPTTSDLSNVQNAVAALGGCPNFCGWDGEDWVSYLNGQNGAQPTAQQQAAYGVTANAFDFDYTTPPTASTQQLINAFNAGYGQPVFFTNPPPITTTTASTSISTSTTSTTPTTSTTTTIPTTTTSASTVSTTTSATPMTSSSTAGQPPSFALDPYVLPAVASAFGITVAGYLLRKRAE